MGHTWIYSNRLGGHNINLLQMSVAVITSLCAGIWLFKFLMLGIWIRQKELEQILKGSLLSNLLSPQVRDPSI